MYVCMHICAIYTHLSRINMQVIVMIYMCCYYVCMYVWILLYDTLVEDTSSACLMIFSMACAAMV
jgi:hypothetical protein